MLDGLPIEKQEQVSARLPTGKQTRLVAAQWHWEVSVEPGSGVSGALGSRGSGALGSKDSGTMGS